jgi:hypothetical protein
MVRKISVAPIEGGWAVRCDFAGAPMYFLRAPQAEKAARDLAARLAAAGEPARIDIHLRDGALGARFLAPPAPPGQARAPASLLWMDSHAPVETVAA